RDTAVAARKERSWPASPEKFAALSANLLFQFVEKRGVVLAYRIKERRKQQFARSLGPGQKIRENIFRLRALPFLLGKSRGIKECPIRHPPVQQTLFVKPVQRGHDRGVRQRELQLLDYIANIALATRPENPHQVKLQAAERQLLGGMVGRRCAVLEKTDHLSKTTLCVTTWIGSCFEQQ